MMICRKCGQTFDEPMKIGVDHEAGDEPIYVCPYCNSFSYCEAVYCTICEEAYPESAHRVNEGVCDECLDRYYNAYIPIAKMLNDKETRKEYMKWQGIQTCIDGSFCSALESIRYLSWNNNERRAFLNNVKDFFLGDKYWFVTKVLNPAVQKYNIGEFERLYKPLEFMRFVGADWDSDSTYYLKFTAHYYDVPEASEEMAKALFLYLHEGIEEEYRTGGTEMHEKLKCAAHEFVADYPHVGLAYCIFCERSWLP